MVLGIISDCVHLRNNSGQIGSKVHVLVRQLDFLSAHFDKVFICAPVIRASDNGSAVSFYSNKNIAFIPVPLAGGNSIFSKLRILFVLPVWIIKIIQTCRKSDFLYLRAPNNISIPGFIISSMFRKEKFSTYTGTWSGYKSEPVSYKLQRRYLSRYFSGPVFVYGTLPGDRANIYSTISPSYCIDDWDEEAEQVECRIKKLAGQMVFTGTLHLITVGSLTDNKNQLFILESMVRLKLLNFDFTLWVAGDGPNLKKYQDFVRTQNLENNVFFLGNIKQEELRGYYRQADIVIQAPIHEGFGKVPIEGFFHGVIPIISDVNLSRTIVGGVERGRVFNNQDELIGHINTLLENPTEMVRLIKSGRSYALQNTLESWSQEILTTLCGKKIGFE